MKKCSQCKRKSDIPGEIIQFYARHGSIVWLCKDCIAKPFDSGRSLNQPSW